MRTLFLALALLSNASDALAAPTSGQLLSAAQRQFPAIYLPSVGARNPATVQWRMPLSEGPTIHVNGFQFEGNTSVSEAELLNAGFGAVANTPLTPQQIYSLTDLVKEIYAAKDIAVSARVPPQDVQGGIVLILIKESSFAGVELDYGFEESFNVDLERIEAVARASVVNSSPVRISEMQRGQLLAIDLHGVAVSGGHHPTEEGNQQLELWIENTPSYSGTLEIDNAGHPVTGSNQLRLTSLYASPFSRGGATYINAIKSQHSEFSSMAYRGPVGLQGATVDLQIGLLSFNTGSYSDNAQSYSLGYRYPLVRTVQQNLFLTLLAEHRDLGYSLNTVELSLDGNSAFESGRLSYNAQLASGSSTQTANSDFTTLSGFLNFSRRYASGWRYNARLNAQISDANLDDALRMAIGGSKAMRGYATDDGLFDEGVVLNFDLQRSLTEKFTLGTFYDLASLRARTDRTDNEVLANIGLSSQIIFDPDIHFNLSAARALKTSSGGTQEGDYRIFAGLTFAF